MTRFLYSVLLLVVMLSAGAGELFAQREKREKIVEVTVTGICRAGEYVTPAEGKQNALRDAMEKALTKANIFEEIHSTTHIALSNEGNNFQEYNNFEMGRINLEGRVLVKERKDSIPMQFKNGLYEYSVTIIADVKKEEPDEDLEFDFTIKGIRDTYCHNQKMTFTITPTQKCYFRVFYLAANPEHKSELLFPDNENYKDFMLEADTSYTFPPPNKSKFLKDIRSKAQDYSMKVSDISNKTEMGWIILVALKKQVPFDGEVTYENINNWLYRIKRNEKRVKEQGVIIVKR